ncbi:hypothetical protein BTA49_10090 [Pseudomonas mosselii]|nr:hypothetical protein CLJ08_07615 [Pseudomonas mosselii]ORT70890.1 hypothetical protein BTA49_10090 [Pseudomonas mosselii]
MLLSGSWAQAGYRRIADTQEQETLDTTAWDQPGSSTARGCGRDSERTVFMGDALGPVVIVRSAKPTRATDINQQVWVAQFVGNDTVRLSNRKRQRRFGSSARTV